MLCTTRPSFGEYTRSVAPVDPVTCVCVCDDDDDDDVCVCARTRTHVCVCDDDAPADPVTWFRGFRDLEVRVSNF